MRKRKADKSIERTILVGMVVSTGFLKEIRDIINVKYFKNSGATKIGNWCLDYYDSFNEAPLLHIKDIYDTHVRNETLTDDESEFINKVLSKMSADWETNEENFNLPYLTNIAEDFFKQAHYHALGQDLITYSSEGKIKEAEHLVSGFKPLNRRSTDKGIDPLTDADLLQQAFDEKFNVLFKLPGEIGHLMNEQFYRGALIGILAPEKRGKSFFLQEFGLRALKHKCKVALFETGDMTVSDRLRRIHSNIAAQPISRFAGSSAKTKIVRIPKLVNDKIEVVEEERKILTWRKALKVGEKWNKMFGRNKIRLSAHANSTVNVTEISHILDTWEQTDGFIPDVIIIDYADILKPEDSRLEFRHQQNETWKALRRLSQERYCCVITATQADAASYKQTSLGLSNFSEDKRKFAHVTAFYALNQTPNEKANRCIRIGELLARESYLSVTKEVTLLQCLDVGRPLIDSYIAEPETYELGYGEDEE